MRDGALDADLAPFSWPMCFTASLGISVAILAAMFTFTYLPQGQYAPHWLDYSAKHPTDLRPHPRVLSRAAAAVLAIFQLGPLGFVTAAGVVLTESAFVSVRQPSLRVYLSCV